MNLRTKASLQVAGGRSRLIQYRSSARNDLTTDQWLETLIASNGICSHCGKFVGIENITLDHIIQLVFDGDHSINNVAPSCSRCNQSRNSGKLPRRKPKPKGLTYQERKAVIDKMWLDTLKR